jgi:hypothetical protein
MQVEMRIGWTKSRMPEYSSFTDGYRPDAEQHTEDITVDVPDEYFHDSVDNAVQRIAEAAFIATNAPFELDGVPQQIREAIYDAGYNGKGAHYSLSVGDTVTVGEVMVTCDHYGWTRVR